MARRFLLCFCSLLVVLLSLFAGCVWLVDPWYYYHGPLLDLPLCLREGRYQNNGIARHMEYDTLLMGTSVTANMRLDDLETMIDGDPQKLIVRGGYFAEFYDPLDIALATHDVKAVYWGADSNCLRRSDAENTWEGPDYLFDQNPFNDVSYLLNKEMFFWDLTAVLERAWENDHRDDATGGYTWGEGTNWGAELALGVYRTMEKPAWQPVAEDAFLSVAKENLKNILQRVDAHPEVMFTFYLAPYSILFWDQTIQSGELEATLSMHQTVLETLTSRPNTRVFYFMDDTALITDLSHYCDHIHYSPEICRQLLERMTAGTPLAPEEVAPRIQAFREFLLNYDYGWIWEP